MTLLPLAVLLTTPLAALATIAGAASIPLAIHLFNRRRYRVVDWAAMRFLAAAIKRTRRRRRLEHWLLLAVRTLLVVLPVMAMAAAAPWAERTWQRILPGAAAAPAYLGRTHHVIVIDASMSMSARNNAGSAFERAQAMAIKLVGGASSGDGFSVIVLAAPPRVIVPGPANDASRVIREIESLHCTHGNADLGQSLQFAEDALNHSRGNYPRRVVYLLTDVQRTQWTAPSTPTGTWGEPWQRLHAKANVAVVDVGSGSADNVAIVALNIADPVVTAGTRSAATATIHNYGPKEKKRVRVELWETSPTDAGRTGRYDYAPPRLTRQELIDLPSGASATVAFPVEFERPGRHRLEIRLAGDTLEADNRRILPVVVRDSLPVLVVNGRPASDPLDTPAGWLSAALDPFLPSQRPPGYPVNVRVVQSNQLGDPDVAIDKYDCVYLCDVPRFGERDVSRLTDYVHSGGTLVVGLGPSVDAEAYRRTLFGDGDGLLPARLTIRQRAPGTDSYSPAIDESEYRWPPFAAFAADDDRTGLLAARFKEYWRIERSSKASARSLLHLSAPAPAGDSLLNEWSRGRGRVILFASTFNTDWTSWPIAPSFPAFVHEVLRYSARQPAQRELAVGEPIDELLPEGWAATEATIHLPDGATTPLTIDSREQPPHLRVTETDRSGLYAIEVAGQAPLVFAVNPPSANESDLARANVLEFPATGTGTDPQIVGEFSQIQHRAIDDEPAAAEMVESPSIVGAAVARWMLLLLLPLLLIEPILAWRFGSARGPAEAIDRPENTPSCRWRNIMVAALTAIPIALVAAGTVVLLHAAMAGELLGFLPNAVRSGVENWLGVPQADPGEGTRWRLDRLPTFTSDPNVDRWLVGGLAIISLALVAYIYVRELKQWSRLAGGPPVVLRIGLILIAMLALLPQLRLVFEREGSPDLAILVDDSQSMAVIDLYSDTANTQAIRDLFRSDSASRLQTVQALLAKEQSGWLSEIGSLTKARMHVYRVSDRCAKIAEVQSVNSIDATRKLINDLKPLGPASRLGEAVRSILHEFRGSTLGGIVVLSDGITTDGDDLSTAAKFANRAGVPLYLVGIGDDREPKDLELFDLRVEDAVQVGDRLVFEARLNARGGVTGSVAVTLSEKLGDKLTPLARQQVSLDASGSPSKIRLVHTPREPGDRVFVLEAEPEAGELDVVNNRLERSVYVSEFKRTRVLYIENRPRYDFRFVKTLLEREAADPRGNRSIELKVLLADADPDFARQDRSALDGFPASREELLKNYDVIVLGDIGPNHPLLGEQKLQWIADFVREKGGGLLGLAGPQFMPHAYRNTPLASVLPVESTKTDSLGNARAAGYKPALTTIGQSHPVFRFAADDAENLEIWNRLKPFLWSATDWQPKPAAEVLAMCPPATGDGVGTPLVLQQFVGAGRVLLIGYQESWRWRFRNDESQFNQYWIRLLRYVARTRPSRAEVRLDRQAPYRRGEPIRVAVHFPDDKPPPDPHSPVRVTVARTVGGSVVERQALQLAAMPGVRGGFETAFTRTPEGTYSFTLEIRDGAAATSPSATARVIAPPGENDRLRMNKADMERAAQISRGKFYSLANAGSLPDELPPMPRLTLHQPRPPWPIWNTPLVLLLTLGLVGGEWVLRKRLQLL